MSAKQLFLIDAHALCYRAYYAVRGLTNSSGQATNAVYGFVNVLRKILKDFAPAYLAVCFDTKATRRLDKFKEYKIQRPKMPEDLFSQIPLIKDVVRAHNLPVFEIEGYEADDVIATLVRRFSKKDMEVVIVSEDKDLFQLVSRDVKILSSRQEKIMGPEDVEGLLGIPSKHVPDYIALAGDKVDNIPGVKGIGEVSARELIKEFGSLEEILAQMDRVSSNRVKTCLQAGREMAVLSKELAVLEEDAPVDVSLDELRITPPDPSKLLEVYNKLEFNKFAAEVAGQVQNKLEFDLEEISSPKAGEKLATAIRKNGSFSFLTEGAGQPDNFFEKPNVLISLGGSRIYRLPVEKAVWLQDVWSDSSITKITHDFKNQLKTLRPYAPAIDDPVFDVMLAGYLILPGRADYSVNTLSWNYLKTAVGENQRSWNEACLINKLFEPLSQELKEKSLAELLEEIEIPLARVLAKMESAGVALDAHFLMQMSLECHKKIQALQKDLYLQAGQDFNLNSPKQLSHVLFETLKLPVIKKTKTGFSTDEEVLTKLARQHGFPAKILEYRQIAKLQSTYIDALPQLVDTKTNRIHASFDQAGTETGRLSSNNPNLQNIPVRTELGREIRKAFVASSPRNVILTADYSQIELRILAHLSGDEGLQKAFAAEEDIHNATAAQIFDVSEKDITREMRDAAKRVNFGIIYGMSSFGLAKDLTISQDQAQDFIDRYFLRYPRVKSFMDEQIKKCERDGFVTTLLQRRRYIPDIHNSNMAIRQLAQRQAINTPVQGSAADLMKLAMIKVDDAMNRKKLKSQMIITVHDELVFDALIEELEPLVEVVRSQMENCLQLSVPIRVTLKQGRNWLETERMAL